MTEKYIINSLSEMQEFGKKFAKTLHSPMTILLNGNLGVGKTELTRSIIRELTGDDTIVPSPTFTLVQTYETKIGDIYHFDLYRIKNESELEEIGLFDAMQNGITIIEWPEIAKRFINPKNTLILDIQSNSDGIRTIEIS